MRKRLTFVLATLALLSGCASIPTEYTSPCACDYKPLNQQIIDTGKAVT